MSIFDKEDAHVDMSGGLETRVQEARQEAIEERELADITGIDLWFSETGFVSPYPDRVIKIEVPNETDLLREIADHIDEPISGRIFCLPEELGELNWELCRMMKLTIGYLPNPDVEFQSWTHITKELRQIHPLDIDSYFEPIHLPKVTEANTDEEEEDTSESSED